MRRALPLLTVLLLCAPATAQESPLPIDLNPDTFGRWHAYISPSAEERRWEDIEWRESFWAAIQEAHVARKPVLLWAMNGHPMGCT